MVANGYTMGRSASTGFALGATAGIAYGLCAPAFRLWPQAGVAFMNSLLHGRCVFGWIADRLRNGR